MPNKKKIIGKPFEKGKSGNPSGRPKGALSNLDVVAGILEGLKRATKKKTAIAAISSAIRDDIKTKAISKSDAIALIAKFMPKELSGPGGKDLIPTSYDLGKLSTAELLTLKKMQDKIEIKDKD